MDKFKRQKTPIDKTKLIYGRHPITDALKNGMSLDKVFILKSIRGDFEKEIRQLCKERNVPLQSVPKEKLNKITMKNHQGILGFLSHIEYQRLEDVYPLIYERGEMPLVLVLDGVKDVRNLGAIARSAEACGVHALVLPHKGSAQINAETLKASAGALSTLPVCRTASLSNAIDYLQMNGVQVIAADLRGEQYLHKIDLTAPTAIVMGAEDTGVSNHLLEKVNEHFIIPMKGETDSFNVSVATGIILYETLKQRL